MENVVRILKAEQTRLGNELERVGAALQAFGVGRAQRTRRSDVGRARIAAAQRARWAKAKATAGKGNVVTMPKKRTMFAAARERIAAAQRARWAKVNDSGHRCNRWRTLKFPGLRSNESINALCLLIVMLFIILGMTRSAHGATFDAYAKKGGNYLKAEFRLWYPDMVDLIRGIVLLVPGSNEDGRADIADPKWQAFAVKNRFALLGCYFADRQHNEMFIERYVNASQGSGMALLRAVTDLSKMCGHPELRNAPLLLWGMSAGGEFNYEFVNWKSSRVAAFVVNKGGIYYTALLTEGARNTPGLLFVGGKDLGSRIEIIRGLFALNRRAGALWALIEEPNVAHELGQSQDLAIAFFEDVFAKRLSKSKSSDVYLSLASISESSGVVGDLKTKQIQPSSTMTQYNDQTCWFPSTRVAREWLALSQRQSVESK